MGNKAIYVENQISADGELTSKKWITRNVTSTEMFVRTYLEDISALAKCSGAEQSVVLCCLKYLNYNTNVLFIDSSRRLEICTCGNLKLNTVNTAISRLVKKNIFIKEGSSKYILNPKLFFFGSDIDRLKVFDLTIRYKIVDNTPSIQL